MMKEPSTCRHLHVQFPTRDRRYYYCPDCRGEWDGFPHRPPREAPG